MWLTKLHVHSSPLPSQLIKCLWACSFNFVAFIRPSFGLDFIPRSPSLRSLPLGMKSMALFRPYFGPKNKTTAHKNFITYFGRWGVNKEPLGAGTKHRKILTISLIELLGCFQLVWIGYSHFESFLYIVDLELDLLLTFCQFCYFFDRLSKTM